MDCPSCLLHIDKRFFFFFLQCKLSPPPSILFSASSLSLVLPQTVIHWFCSLEKRVHLPTFPFEKETVKVNGWDGQEVDKRMTKSKMPLYTERWKKGNWYSYIPWGVLSSNGLEIIHTLISTVMLLYMMSNTYIFSLTLIMQLFLYSHKNVLGHNILDSEKH